MTVHRRSFLKGLGALGLAAQFGGETFAARSEFPRRPLGHTGEQVSILGVGGYHLGMPSEPEAIRIVRTALDNGMNFLDNCWDYNDGDSEVRMGKALRDGYRQKAFLMTKIDGRDAKTRRPADRRIAPAAADRSPSTCCNFTRSSAWTIPTASSPQAARWRRCSQAQRSGQASLHRLHRAQESAHSPAHAGGCRAARVHLRHRADAAQRDGRALRELRATSCCPCW